MKMVLYLESTNKFIKKSLVSFKAGKFYQAEREFTNGLLRDLESKSFENVETSFKLILPILEEHSLYHESEQILQAYLRHARKRKDVKVGIIPIINVLKGNMVSNIYPNCTTHFLNAFMDFTTSTQEPELIAYISENSLNLLTISEKSTNHLQIMNKIFNSLIVLSKYEQLELIADKYFLNTLNVDNNFKNILYSVLILAINGKNEQALEILKNLRKELPLEIQKDSDVFQCCSEFLLASSSNDYDWVLELQQHFSETLKDKTVKMLIINLIKKSFPDKSKVSLFDFFNL